VPNDPEKAMEVLTNGQRREVDVGTADGRRFLLQAGIGFDAEVIRSVKPAEKRRFGRAAFVLKGARALFSRRATKTELVVDGRRGKPDLFWMLLANSPTYAGIKVAEEDSVEDGRLTSYVIEGAGPLSVVSSAASVVMQRTSEAENVSEAKVEQVEIKTPGLAVHADGEDLGDTPMVFGVEPHALPLLVPEPTDEAPTPQN
jgi:diacylglycerol kinase family enzyme